MCPKKSTYRAAIYMRISRDDEDKSESSSIQNQRDLLNAFVQKDPQIELVREFSDDGFTGTNFERPGFQKMMSMVEKKSINCIIVKDLSRLGRNYIETGRLIDQIFPMLGIRFISVNDNYDSLNEFNETDQILIPFKNLINDAYCKDMSMKVRSQLDVKRRTGQFIGSFAAYGYRKDPKDKNHLIIDNEPARIVRQIFGMKLDGYSQTKIADHLNEMGVLTPQQYKRSVGLNSNAGYWRSEEPQWCAAAVQRILTSEIYIGNLVQGKTKKINYKVKQSLPVSENEWIRTTGAHEPIITKEAFERVQYMLESDTRTSPEQDTVDIFSGIIKCADCGQNMVKRVVKNKYGVYYYFTCSSYKMGEGCSSHLINVSYLKKAVLHMVQKQMRLLLDLDKFQKCVDKAPEETQRIRVFNDQITALDREIAKYQEMKENLYEDFREDIVDEDDYEELKKRFQKKIQSARQSLRNVKARKEDVLSRPVIPPDWIQEIKKLGEVNQLTRKMVIMLIDRILVYDKNHIEVVFHYGDEVKELSLSERAADSNQGGGVSS